MYDRRRLGWGMVLFVTLVGLSRAEPPSPFELARGLRQSGRADLALEYLQEVEKRLSPEDQKALPLEQALCLLAEAQEQAEEGKRDSLLGEARLRLDQFLRTQTKHPRAVEANLALADILSMQAQAQLSRSLRIELPPPPPEGSPDFDRIMQERERALQQRRKEAEKAAPLFLDAAKRYDEAAKLLKAQADAGGISPAEKRRLNQEIFDAELRAGINLSRLAETVLGDTPQDTKLRSDHREKALKKFEQLATGSSSGRSAWIARAWKAETLFEMGKPKEAEAEFAAILKTNLAEATDGKRLAEFFQLRRDYLNALRERNATQLEAVAARLRQWLERYGQRRRVSSQDEQWAVRYYLAFTLQVRADLLLPPPPKGGGKMPELPTRARALYQEAEKHYRLLSQQPNDYQGRAERYRLYVLRRLIGETVRPIQQYRTFEEAHVAAIVQLAHLRELEEQSAGSESRWEERVRELKDQGRAWALLGAELQRRAAALRLPAQRRIVVALLERAHQLATPQDNPNDVMDNLLRLVFFYLTSGEPQRAAVLGEHIARHMRAPSHKLAAAGLLAINGYLAATAHLKPDLSDPTAAQQFQEQLQRLRQIDRSHALRLAQYLDQRFPDEPITDAIRLRLALLLIDDRQEREAYKLIIRVRPGFSQIAQARLIQAFLAINLLTNEQSPLSDKDKQEVYQRTLRDLSQLPAPVAAASGEQVREYYQVQARLGQLYLLQDRFQPQAEKKQPGYERALALADKLLKDLATFKGLQTNPPDKKGTPALSLDGREAQLLARDLQLRASLIRIARLLDQEPPQLDEAEKTLRPIVDDLLRTGPLLTDQLKQWSTGEGDAGDEEAVKRQKAQIANLAATCDRTRREIGLLGFRLAVQQGNIDEAKRRLDALKKFGLTIETSQDMYEQLARQLAVRLSRLQNQKREAEAEALSKGVQLVLQELRSSQNLSPRTILFIAQTLATIGDYDNALQEARKIEAPKVTDLPGIESNTEWWQVDVTKIADNQVRTRFQDACRDYRVAILIQARCLRQSGKLQEAEKLLVEAIGDQKNRRWGFTSLDLRRELAYTYEAQAAAESNPQKANPLWRNALNEWTTLFQYARADVQRLKEDTPAEQVRRVKSAFFDAFYEVQRVLIAANKQLQKDQNLQRSLETVGRRIAEMEITNKIAEHEAQGTSIILPETWNRYYELLANEPIVKKAYQDNRGKLFLQPAPQ
ncbi:MAG: hypothetical protein KatS3mg106_463 [Gemmataceae bacterium]|jgi:hypothetical protein|nr:MAG: hypothetical protein KatS3mg106_463 [Gemmataceae bacterium]